MLDHKKSRDFFVESEKLTRKLEEEEEEEGPLKLKRHWKIVGGRFYVPEIWEHEVSLREWNMDSSSFDTILVPKGIELAPKALMSQGKQARSGSGSDSTSTSRMCSRSQVDSHGRSY
ncbi:hypothetical protein T459_28608 [Capsicum annuum]|uniref:Uncharacterized protein n=1 Tax=Capsicum annuum TaxID=4072 RepID=A0A2G2YHR0_CAPAN|nr:hypothetical protein T459_28608 [Capsicum annuum]